LLTLKLRWNGLGCAQVGLDGFSNGATAPFGKLCLSGLDF
jgi:hypothetical protein